MNISLFLNLVAQFREVYFKKTFGEVVMLVAKGDPRLNNKALAAIAAGHDCEKNDKEIWNFLKFIGIRPSPPEVLEG